MRVTRVLVCDLGQVVLPFDFSGRADALRSRCGSGADDPAGIVRRLHRELNMTCGGATGEEFFRRIAESVDTDLTYEEFCALYCQRFWEDRATVALVRRAHAVRRILLSNTDDIHWRWVRQQFPNVLAGFDRLVASHEAGLCKPDEAIFRYVESLTGFPAESHVLIDDLDENVEGARACGWDAILHTTAPALEAALRSRALL